MISMQALAVGAPVAAFLVVGLVGFAEYRWIERAKKRAAIPQPAAPRKFADLAQQPAKDAAAGEKAGSFGIHFRTAAAEQRPELLDAFLRERIATVSGASAAELNYDLPIKDLGVDSLRAVQLAAVIRTEVGIDLPVALLLDRHVTVAEIGKQLVDEFTANSTGSGTRQYAAARMPASKLEAAVEDYARIQLARAELERAVEVMMAELEPSNASILRAIENLRTKIDETAKS